MKAKLFIATMVFLLGAAVSSCVGGNFCGTGSYSVTEGPHLGTCGTVTDDKPISSYPDSYEYVMAKVIEECDALQNTNATGYNYQLQFSNSSNMDADIAVQALYLQQVDMQANGTLVGPPFQVLKAEWFNLPALDTRWNVHCCNVRRWEHAIERVKLYSKASLETQLGFTLPAIPTGEKAKILQTLPPGSDADVAAFFNGWTPCPDIAMEENYKDDVLNNSPKTDCPNKKYCLAAWHLDSALNGAWATYDHN